MVLFSFFYDHQLYAVLEGRFIETGQCS